MATSVGQFCEVASAKVMKMETSCRTVVIGEHDTTVVIRGVDFAALVAEIKSLREELTKLQCHRVLVYDDMERAIEEEKSSN